MLPVHTGKSKATINDGLALEQQTLQKCTSITMQGTIQLGHIVLLKKTRIQSLMDCTLTFNLPHGDGKFIPPSNASIAISIHTLSIILY